MAFAWHKGGGGELGGTVICIIYVCNHMRHGRLIFDSIFVTKAFAKTLKIQVKIDP